MQQSNNKNEVIKFVLKDENATPPYRQTDNAAGIELFSTENIILDPGQIVKVETNIIFEIPYGYYGQIADKSSISSYGVKVLGGVIDSDYRGSIKVLLINLGKQTIMFPANNAIAQMIIIPYLNLKCQRVIIEELSETFRGDNGFGSGIKQ
jgi:dUTP pyrophosphatase